MGSGSKTPANPRAFSDGDSADGADNLAVFHCVFADFSSDECAYGLTPLIPMNRILGGYEDDNAYNGDEDFGDEADRGAGHRNA